MKPRIFAVTMPKWGIEMQQGTITDWHAHIGDMVQKGDHLIDVETDKIVNSVEAPASGVLRRIVAEKGTTENVGALVAVLAEASATSEEVTAFVHDFKPIDARFEQDDARPLIRDAPPPAPPAPPTPAEAAPAADGETRVSPIARRIAERLGVDVAAVRGTGRHGRVSKEDVEAYAAGRLSSERAASSAAAAATPSTASSPVSAPPPAAAPTRIAMTAMRGAIARRLVESKQAIPHYRLVVDVDFGALGAHRTALNQRSGLSSGSVSSGGGTGGGGAGISVNDLLVRACALALMRHPVVNSHFTGDAILEFPTAHICIAVATDGGLITPVIRSADVKTAARIAAESTDLSARARRGQLTREEISGGTFTISNLGMFGIDRFDAIINPPQVGILAVGAATERVVAKQGIAVVARLATLTLSADHRVVDGAVGAQFLKTLQSLIEAPESL